MMTTRLKALATAAILVVVACSDDGTTTPPPQGSIEGLVAVEGQGIDGVTVTLSDGMTTTTAGGGSYRFTGVEAGSYTVTISGYPDDASFDAATGAATISAADQIVAVNFAGVYIRSAIILGRVSVEGDAVRNVTVRLTGVSDATATTDSNGGYQFSGLRKGAYTVEISDFAGDEIGFSNTSQTTSVGVGETKVLSFDGAYLRTAGILGQVTVGEDGIAGVTVTASGEGVERSSTTDGEGQYAINGLRAGDYQVEVSDYDAAHYRFDEATKTVTVIQNEKTAVNFTGVKTRSASIGGMLYLDENEKNDMYDAGREEMLAVAGVAVVLNGPSINDQSITVTNAQGQFLFDSLEAGQYRVLLSPEQSPAVAKALMGLRHGGSATGTVLEVAGDSENAVNIPFDVTHQTVAVTTMFGDGKKKVGGPLAGAKVSLYATVNNAIAGRAALGTATTDTTGTAEFYFERADDGDGVVFAVLDTVGHADLVLVGNDIAEISYPGKSRSVTSNAFKVLNTRATFQLWVKNIMTGIGGDEFQAGWTPEVVTDPAHTAADTTNPSPVAGMATDKTGRSVHTATQNADSLPVTYYISLAASQSAAMGESWEATLEPSDAAGTHTTKAKKEFLTYVHAGLTPPGDTADLGLMRLKFTTQSLTVAAHYERDHLPGLTYVGSLLGNDRAGKDAGANTAGNVTLWYRDEATGDDMQFISDDPKHDINTGGNPRTFSASTATATFRNLPTDVRFIVVFATTSDRHAVGSSRAYTWRNYGEFTTGAFGEDGGTAPNVKLCPQSTDADNCSTFAFVRSHHRFYVDPRLRSSTGTDVASYVFMAPAESYNLTGAEMRRLETRDDGPPYNAHFQNLPEGLWKVWATARSEKDYLTLPPGTIDDPVMIKITDAHVTNDVLPRRIFFQYLNTSVSGTVVNDRLPRSSGGDDAVEPAETQAGITMVLNRKVNDRVRTPVDTTVTDALGAFKFQRIPEDTFFVTSPDTTVLLISGAQHSWIPKPYVGYSDEVVTAKTRRKDVVSGKLPMWNYSLSRIEDRDGYTDDGMVDTSEVNDVDFVILFKDGLLSGTVSLAAADDAGARSVVITALRCREIDTLPQCKAGKYADPVGIHVEPDGKGRWSIPNLREGNYEVRIAVSSDYQVQGGDTRDRLLLRGRAARATKNWTIEKT